MSLPLTTDRLYIHIAYEEKEWAKEQGMKWDDDGKCWFLPPGRDPLPLRHWWSYLEKTYDDRATLKRKGCRYNGNLRKWYVPNHLDNLDFDDFTNWWPDDLRQYLLCGRYAIHEKHSSSSGQANVYRAWDVTDNGGGYYAVKLFKKGNESENFSTHTQRNAAKAEIKSLKKLGNHPNILELEAADDREEINSICLVSRWMPGGSLETIIGTSDEDTARILYRAMENCGYENEDEEDIYVKEVLKELETGQRDPWIDNSDILFGILEGLKYAHSLGIYHRDLKPANILLDYDMQADSPEVFPVLCDFGAAKIHDELSGGGSTDQKYTLVQIQTRAYRWDFGFDTEEGQKEGQNQHTWDLVSWAIMAIEIVANENIESPSDAVEFLNEKIAKDLDPEIVELLQQAISKDPDKRPQDIGKFQEKIVELTERRKQRLNWKP